MRHIKQGATLLVVILLLGACTTAKQTTYFQDLPADSLLLTGMVASYSDPIIQTDDVLSITIQTIDPANSTAISQDFGIQAQGVGSGTGTSIVQGFLVDKKGNVSLAMLGDVPVAGLTTTQAKERIREIASQRYKNPTVQVRFANYRITVLGEVNQPATYAMPNEKVSVMDALGMAGDLTIFGKRNNVLLIRDSDGQKEFARLNLNSSDLFASPYYYLKQNDVIYVEASKGRAVANNAATMQTISIVSTIVTLSVLLFTRIR